MAMRGLLNVGVNPKTLQDTIGAIPKGLGLGGGKKRTSGAVRKSVKRGFRGGKRKVKKSPIRKKK